MSLKRITRFKKNGDCLVAFSYIIMTDRSDFFSFALLFSSPLTIVPATHHAFCHLLIFFIQINSSKFSFRNTIRMPNTLKPDLGPNCLQKLSADDTIKQRVKCYE